MKTSSKGFMRHSPYLIFLGKDGLEVAGFFSFVLGGLCWAARAKRRDHRPSILQ